MSGPDGDEMIRLLKECILDHGMPDQLMTYHCTQFFVVKGGVLDFNLLCVELKVQHTLASIAHPQTLGKTEQHHNTLKNYLDQVLPDLEQPSRNEVQKAVARLI
jgi:hypothetical protein